MTQIIVSSGMTPVHSFDLWGPVVDSEAMSARNLEMYREVAAKIGVEPAEIDAAANDYQLLADGHPSATGARKGQIIDRVDKVLKAQGVEMKFSDFLQEDGLYVMGEILDAGEQVIIFTSKPWDKNNLPESIASRMGEVYHGGKTNPEEFRRVCSTEASHRRHLVSHTADELPELIGAIESNQFHKEGLIYVARNESNTEAQVRDAGIERFVTDLRDVHYTNLVKRN